MVIPAAILIVFDYVRHFVLPYTFLHGWTGFILLWVLALAGVMVFSQTVFMIIGRMQQEVLHHNRELAMTAETATALGQKAGFRSCVSVPLKAEGKVMGVIALASVHERTFAPSVVSMLLSIGSQLGMAMQNAVLFQDLVRRNKEMAALNSVSAAVSSSLDLNEVMVAAIDSVMELMEAEAGETWLVEERSQDLILAVHRGLFSESFHEVKRFHLGEGFPGLVAQTGEPVVTNSLGKEARFLRDSVKEKGFQFMACLPLKSRTRVVGTMLIASCQPHELSSSDLELLSSIGAQVGVAIENASLHQKIQNLAVLKERGRIAREMHDGLAQVLGYVNTKTQAVKKLLSAGETTQARQELGQLEEAAREVYADVREAIVGLRATTSAKQALSQTLREYLEWFSRQNSIQTELKVEGSADTALEPNEEIQLVRIVQEALSNVRKHAMAAKAWVGISATNGRLCLTVQDDGQGFDPDRVTRSIWPQFGLQSMKERAESVGGAFELISSPGRGTTVRIMVPKRKSH